VGANSDTETGVYSGTLASKRLDSPGKGFEGKVLQGEGGNASKGVYLDKERAGKRMKKKRPRRNSATLNTPSGDQKEGSLKGTEEIWISQ